MTSKCWNCKHNNRLFCEAHKVEVTNNQWCGKFEEGQAETK
jgi:hypothetical protein